MQQILCANVINVLVILLRLINIDYNKSFSIASGINEESEVCMNDCNSEGEREATKYELMCCDPVNLGKFIKFQDEDRQISYISCPLTIPDWCSYYVQ